jgi:hypothetical protein
MGHPLNTLGQTLVEQGRETVTGGDLKVPPPKNSFITWAAPGILLSGSDGHAEEGRHFEANANGETLTVNGIQRIGFINHLVVEAPDPLLRLTEADFSGTKPKGSK